MNRYGQQRLDDIIAAIGAIRLHLAKGDLSDGLVFDTSHAILQATVEYDLPELEQAVNRLYIRVHEG